MSPGINPPVTTTNEFGGFPGGRIVSSTAICRRRDYGTDQLGCAETRLKVSDASQWWSVALAGRSTRAECEQQADRLLLAFENGCLPVHDSSELWGAAIGLTHQVLRDWGRTLRVLELQIATMGPSNSDQLGLLRERAEALRQYGRQAAAIDKQAAAATTMERECGRLSSQPTSTPAASADGVEEGGWLTTKSSARGRWGGEGRCTIREMTSIEWSTASAACRKRLAQAPFIVRGGGDALLNRSQFRRDAMLATMSRSHVAVGHTGHNAPIQMPFVNYTAQMRREGETEAVDAVTSYAFESQLLETHHRELLRGLQLPDHLGGLLNLQAPLLANLAMGSAGSGVYFHRHDVAISALFFGEKRWFFHPDLPGSPAMREEHAQASEGFLLPGASSSALLANQSDRKLAALGVLSCLQQPGDLVYTPHMWYHATASLSETVGVALRESSLGPMVTDATGRSRYLPLDAATRRWVALTQDPEGERYAPLTHEKTGQPRPVSEGRLSFDWGRGWLATTIDKLEDASAASSGIMLEMARRGKEAHRQLELQKELERNVPSRQELLQRIANRKNKQQQPASSRSEL
jgi:hypothetical protein